MRKLGALLLQRQLRCAAAPALDQQRHDQRGLQQERCRDENRLLSIDLPEGRPAEGDHGVRGNRILVDPPFAHLPPIHAQRRGCDLGQLQRGRRRARENRVQDFRTLSSGRLKTRHAAADDTRADERVERTVDRRSRHRSDQGRGIARIEEPPVAIQIKARREHERVRSQPGHALLDRRGGQRGQKLDVQAAGDFRHVAPQLRLPGMIALGRAGDNQQSLRARMPAQGLFNRAREVLLDRYARDIRRQRRQR